MTGKPAELEIRIAGKSIRLTITFQDDDEARQAFEAIRKSIKDGELRLIMPIVTPTEQLQ